MGEMNDAGQWVGWAGSAGIGLALGLGVLYLILRGTAWSPGHGDPVRAVRTHAMITALIAFFASGTAGLSRLATEEAFERLSIVLGPVLGFVLVYVVAQHTWPRPSGADVAPWLWSALGLTALGFLVVLRTIALLLVLLCWRSPHVSELGSRTVPGLEGYDAGRSPRVGVSPSPPGTARAVLRLRLDGATLAWMTAVPIAALGVFFLWATPADGEKGWSVLLWSALPCAAALLILGFTEFGVRRGHCPAQERVTTGKASTWPVLALGLAVLLAAVWCVLCLTTPVPQPGLAAVLAAATAGFVLLSAALTRLALRRPALGRTTGEQDAAIRTGGANRLLAVGAAGVFAVTGAALLAGVQVWNGFLTSAVLDLGINDLPDGLLLIRALLLFMLFGLLVACVIAPAPAVPGVRRRPRSAQPAHAEPGGSLR